eukprot:Partr_v1_DN28479_c1_g1_i1_m41419 putative Centrosomal protein 164kDa
MSGAGQESVVLDEEIDSQYEPTQEEILEYADFIGLDPASEPHLLWIAREGLMAPLPADWKPCQTDDNQVYYFNFATGESLWDHPCDEIYRSIYQEEKAKQPLPPPGWSPSDDIDRHSRRFLQSAASVHSRDGDESGSSGEDILQQLKQSVELKQSKEVKQSVVAPVQSVKPSQVVDIKDDTTDPDSPPSESRPVSRPGSRQGATSSSALGASLPKQSLFQMTQAAAQQTSLKALGPLPENESVRRSSSYSALVPESHPSPIPATTTTAAAVTQEVVSKPSSLITAVPKQKSYLGSILDHLDASIADDSQLALGVSGGKKDIQQLQKPDHLSKAVSDRAEDIKRQFNERELEERKQHESKLASLKLQLANERDSFENEQRRALESGWDERRRKIEKDFAAKCKQYEKTRNDDFDSFVRDLKEEMTTMENQERERSERDLKQRVASIQKEMERKYEAEFEKGGYKDQLAERKKKLEADLDKDLQQLRADNQAKLNDLKRSFAEQEATELARHKQELLSIQSSVSEKRDQENARMQQELDKVRERWLERIKSAENELQSRESYLRAQLSETNQKQLHDTEAEFKRQFTRLENDWNDKINRLRLKLASEQNVMEERLVSARKESFTAPRASFSASLAVRKQELDAFTHENDQLFAQQKRRKDYLDNEAVMLNKMEAQLLERRRKIETESFRGMGNVIQETASVIEYQSQDDIGSEAYDTVPQTAAILPSSPSKSRRESTKQFAASTSPKRRTSEQQGKPSIRETQHSPTRSQRAPAAAHHDSHTDNEYEDTTRSRREIRLPNVDGTRLSRELERTLNRDKRNMKATKEYLTEQQDTIFARQKELQESREKWQQQMENLTRATLSNDLTLEELGASVDDKRESVRQPLPSNAFTNTILSYNTASVTVSATRDPTPNASLRIAALEEERKRTDNLLRGHSAWLHDFKQRIGHRTY